MAKITIKDPTLHLMLLDEVVALRDEAGIGALRAGYERYLRKTTSKGVAWEVLEACDDYETHETFERFLLQLPMTKKELASLGSFFADGDHRLLGWIRPDFADTRQFRVRSLSGIEHCTGLTLLDLGLVADRCSLKPVAALESLKKINIWRPDDVSDVETILELPSLTELHIANLSASKHKRAWKPVIASLKKRGVKVT